MKEAGDNSLLLTLEEVSQLVSHSHDTGETLANIVRLIQKRFGTAVCSVYVLEPDRKELVLAATVGLKAEGVGLVRMQLNEGLTGLVAEMMRPVVVADAFRHPRFKYFAEAGEDAYHSFLGVPLVEGGLLVGVLVVQTVEPRAFSPDEVRMLVTIAAQLAPLVGDARLLERVSAAAHPAAAPASSARPTMTTLHGVALSPGGGIGRAYVLDGWDEWRKTVPAKGNGPAVEKARLQQALAAAHDEMSRLSQRIAELVGEDHGAILHAQLIIMQDRVIEKDLESRIDSGDSAEAALLTTLDKYVAAFQKVATPFFQERVYDVKDVFRRLLWQLRPRSSDGSADADRVVLVAREASVMELFAVEPARLAAVVVEHGGPQSHAAILARSLGIPMVGQVVDFAALQRPGRLLMVDGTAGFVGLDPPADAIAAPGPRSRRPASPITEPAAGLPRVEVNINILQEIGDALELGAIGVGLYRSEFLFLARRTLPTEEEQYGIYRKLVQQLAGRPVAIRTFDIRPDKLASYSQMGTAETRPLDWRRILDSPSLQQLFREQVRAVLRAAARGPVRLLIPLVTTTDLLDFVVKTVAAAKEALTADGLEFGERVPIGAMIEVPAAAPLVPDWTGRVDYFALGTNDLTASALGLERDDPDAILDADPLHPGIIRIIDAVIQAAHSRKKPVTVCGEMAADPLGALALTVLGVDSLSVPVQRLVDVRRTLAGQNPAELTGLRSELLARQSSVQAREFLARYASSGRTGQ
jgi:phosphotransferase system enzyme I (PtsP)